jgi:hypothetical protein
LIEPNLTDKEIKEEGVAERHDARRREQGKPPLTPVEAAGIAMVHIDMCEAMEKLERRHRGQG